MFHMHVYKQVHAPPLHACSYTCLYSTPAYTCPTRMLVRMSIRMPIYMSMCMPMRMSIHIHPYVRMHPYACIHTHASIRMHLQGGLGAGGERQNGRQGVSLEYSVRAGPPSDHLRGAIPAFLAPVWQASRPTPGTWKIQLNGQAGISPIP